MEIEKLNKMERFFRTYSAHFGKLTVNDGIEVYEDWLKSPHVDIDLAVKVLGRLAENWDGKSRPRLGKIKRAVRESMPEGSQRKPQSKCNLCHGSGSVNAVTGGDSPDTQRYVNRPLNYAYKTNRLFPCTCEKGKEYYYKQNQRFQDSYSLQRVEYHHEYGFCFYTSTQLWKFMEECNKARKPAKESELIQDTEDWNEVEF